MSNLIERRDRLREAVPHLASASGSIASFQTDMRANLEEIKIHFNPVQSGTGTPSPTNVRPLSGWTGCDIYISPTQDASQGNQIPVSWSDTYYGGYVDYTRGVIVVEKVNEVLRYSNSWTISTNYAYQFGYSIAKNIASYFKENICSHYLNTRNTYESSDVLALNQNGAIQIPKKFFTNSGVAMTDAGLRQYLEEQSNLGTPVTVCAPLATPIEISLTNLPSIKTLKGVNNIWSNANGNIDVKYWKH